MKSEERHELKTNELADWIANFPQWAQNNLRTIIYVAVIAILVLAAYLYKIYEKNTVEVRKQVEFTSVISRIPNAKIQILQAQAQGNDMSYVLLQPQKDLEIAAQDTKNNNMAALALIKRGDVIRMDLHYRPGTVTEQDLTADTNKAKENYTQALAKAAGDPLLTGQAKLGLGLCEEELGNFDKAKELYTQIVDDKALAGTPAAASAKMRILTMTDYETKIAFMPAPPQAAPAAAEPQPAAAAPQIQLPAAGANTPAK